MQADLEYTQDGMFTRFLPCTEAGEAAWRVMAKQDADAVLVQHTASVLRQLRSAGYSVAKAKKPTMYDDELLKELEA